MSSTPRNAPPVCLVIRWSNHVAADAGPARLLRRLIEARLPATWAIEQPAQSAHLAAAPQLVEHALLLPQVDANLSDALADGLHRFSVAGHDVATLAVAGQPPRGQSERQLAQLGVRAIVTESNASGSGSIRPLPFGLWQATPHGTLPSRRRWLRRVGGVPQELVAGAAGPAVVTADAAELIRQGARAWSELELAIDQLETANERSAIRIATVADLAAELTRQAAPKPQRSILRAA
jgi:hypothetical protein